MSPSRGRVVNIRRIDDSYMVAIDGTVGVRCASIADVVALVRTTLEQREKGGEKPEQVAPDP
jgi:hypothetical protein